MILKNFDIMGMNCLQSKYLTQLLSVELPAIVLAGSCADLCCVCKFGVKKF